MVEQLGQVGRQGGGALGQQASGLCWRLAAGAPVAALQGGSSKAANGRVQGGKGMQRGVWVDPATQQVGNIAELDPGACACGR